MELSSKSKRSFKLKSSNQKQNELRSWFDSIDGPSGEDDDHFAVFSKPDVTKTPVAPLKSRSASPKSQNLSPQFRVGWNDGSQKNICDMSSPVSAMSARRKIRRCPENLLSKISIPVIKPEENSCDILQCINWAKSLIGSTNFQSCNEEEPGVHDESITEITESIKDTSLDIALDDSSNELMILCSQAVEESVSSGKLTLENKQPEFGKHHITPNRNTNPNKRFKPQLNLNEAVEGNTSNFGRGLDGCDRKVNAVIGVRNLTKKFGVSSENVSKNDLFDDDEIFKRPDQTSVNNNHANLKNLNDSNTSSKTFGASCGWVKEDKIISPLSTVTTSASDKSLSASSDDNIKSHLDDEDDIFCSLDFSFLDSIQNKTSEIPKPVSKPSTNVIKPQMKNNNSVTLDTKPLVTKYSKQEIEKRRQEARKRLLFNKKHKSM